MKVEAIFYSVAFGYALVLVHFLVIAYLGWNFFPTVPRLFLILSAISTYWRIFLNHGFGHRYLSHKSYDTYPWMVQLMAVSLSCSSIGTIYYWIFAHEFHHAHCDTEKDMHSPVNLGFWRTQFSILGDGVTEDIFAMIGRSAKDGGFKSAARDKFTNQYDANLMWLKYPAVPVLLFVAENLFFIGVGMYGGYHPVELLYWMALLPNYITTHARALTNSAAHIYGERPYTGFPEALQPTCQATNCWWVGLLNGVEGWHSNHHAFAKSARHGLLWYEVDWIWWSLCLLAELGLIWNVVEVSEEIRLAPRTVATNAALLKKERNTFGPWYRITYEKKEKKNGKHS